jgi:hypothetical protein
MGLAAKLTYSIQESGENDLDFVVSALDATPRVTNKLFFWSGIDKLESIVRSWQTRWHKLFKLAETPNGHAHRFRDTFPSNCYAPVYPSKEFRSCSAIRVCESLRSITHPGCVQDKNNLRLIWHARGLGTHSYFPRGRYTRGTPRKTIVELQQFQSERMVPGVGVEPT